MSTVAVWQDCDAALVAELGALETRLHSTWAQMLSVVAEIDSRGTAATVGYTTTVELLRAVGRVSLGEARARVAASADVLPSRGLNGAPVQPKLPATAAAVAEHAIGAADVRVIRSVLARIPPHLGDRGGELDGHVDSDADRQIGSGDWPRPGQPVPRTTAPPRARSAAGCRGGS